MHVVQVLIKHWLLLTQVNLAMGTHLNGLDIPDNRHHKVQHGHCTYTFLLPEIDNCHPPPPDYQVSNALQRDAPAHADLHWPNKKIEALESIMENNTLWLQKLESYIHDSVKADLRNPQQTAVRNQSTSMDVGTDLGSQSAQQMHKLTDADSQVMNQTSRMEVQVPDNSLSSNKLEKELLLQGQEINKLREKNSFLETKVLEMEEKHRKEIEVQKAEKLHVEDLLARQSDLIREVRQQLSEAMQNNSILQKQQSYLMETVAQLSNLVSQYNHIPVLPKEEQVTFRDCADAYKSGLTTSGVYTLQFLNSTDTVQALCDMDTAGGGWTIFQHRKDGSVNFHQTWKEYKEGFGTPAGEYWLGNEFVHQLTSQGSYNLRIQLRDWDGNEAYSLYDHFSLGSEDLNYRLNVRGYSGTAGRISSFSLSGTDFSTKDADNDRCSCKCAQIATGGWWFDACGPSNLNGIYYTNGPGTAKYNGIKWHYWKGPSHGLKSGTMMIRPVDF